MRVQIYQSQYWRIGECPACSHNVNAHSDIMQQFPLCQSCWEGPFTAHLGLFHTHVVRQNDSSYTGGYAYATSWAELKSRANAGCIWCRLLSATRSKDDSSTPSETPVKLIVGIKPASNEISPRNAQELTVCTNGLLRFEGYLYTSSGVFSLRILLSLECC